MIRKLNVREKYLLGALVALLCFAPALNSLASTPQRQVMFGPGQPVTLTGAGPAGSNTAEVIIDTVATKTTGKLLSIRNNGTEKASFAYDGTLTCPGVASTTTDTTLTTGTVQKLAHTTSVIASGGSVLRVSSTSADTGTTTGTLLDLQDSGSAAATLAKIAASNASQTSETAFSVVQSGTTTGYTGDFVSLTGSSTTGAGNLLKLTTVNTSDGSAESIVANSASSSTKGILALSGTGLTSGIGIKATGGGANMLTGGILADLEMGAATLGAGLKLVTSGVYTDTAAAPLWVSASSASTASFGIERIDAAGITTGSALVINSAVPGTMTNAGSAIRVTDGTSNTFRVGVDGHLSGLQTTAPVVTSSGGSAATCTDGAGSAGLCTDSHGIMGYTTAVGTAAITLTFHTAYAKAPVCVITPIGANTETDFVNGTTKPVASTTASTLVITPAGNWAATAKTFAYICME